MSAPTLVWVCSGCASGTTPPDGPAGQQHGRQLTHPPRPPCSTPRMHLPPRLQGERSDRLRGGTLGMGLLLGGAAFAHGLANGCRKAEILAINDDGGRTRLLSQATPHEVHSRRACTSASSALGCHDMLAGRSGAGPRPHHGSCCVPPLPAGTLQTTPTAGWCATTPTSDSSPCARSGTRGSCGELRGSCGGSRWLMLPSARLRAHAAPGGRARQHGPPHACPALHLTAALACARVHCRDLPHLLVWGGEGTRMDADIGAMLRRWTPALRKQAGEGWAAAAAAAADQQHQQSPSAGPSQPKL